MPPKFLFDHLDVMLGCDCHNHCRAQKINLTLLEKVQLTD